MTFPKHAFPIIGAQYPGAVVLAGSFLCDGANKPSIVFPQKRAKFDVSAPSPTGVYTVTLSDGPIVSVVAPFAALVDPDPASTRRAFMGSQANLSSDGTFQIVTQSTAGTAANIAGAALCVVTFVLWLSDSTLVR